MLAATARALVSRRRSPGAICRSPFLLRSLSSSAPSSPAAATSSSSSSSSSGSSSSSNGETEVLLLRDYISRRLTGYFSAPAASSPVGELARALLAAEKKQGSFAPTSSIDFPSLSGRSAYEHALSRLYRALAVSWLTPSELFSPHYGRAVARFVAEDARARAKTKEKKESEIEIRVVEVGAGRGTLAADFLGYLSEVEPALYQRTRYVSLEVSPSLARAQEHKVTTLQLRSRWGGDESENSSSSSRRRFFSSVVGDASDCGAWRRAAAEAFGEDGDDDEENRHLYVLAFEVLDNLPHDRVVLWKGEEGEGEEEGEGKRGGWLQTHVEVEAAPSSSSPAGSSSGRPLKELLGPVSDPLIALCLAASQQWQQQQEGSGSAGSSNGVVARFFDSLFSFAGVGRVVSSSSSSSEGEIVFLPTGAASMFSSIFEVAPDHTLLAADFDALPNVAVSGAGAPLVSSTRGGVARDFSSLYSPPAGEAVDIFFPTNFDALSELYVECARRRKRRRRSRSENESNEEEEEETSSAAAAARHCKQSSFLALAADSAAFSRGAVSTASGWSPMLDDWGNTAVLVARSKEMRKRKKE